MQNFLDTGVVGICKFSGVEADNAIPGLSQPRITFSVSSHSRLSEVMLSINFQDKLGGVDGEIRHVRAYGCLAANVNSIVFFEFSQIAPEPFFTISHAVAKLSRPSQGSG